MDRIDALLRTAARLRPWVGTSDPLPRVLFCTDPVHAAERCGAEAVVISPVFPSNSPSAATPLGVAGVGEITKESALPVYALSGVNAKIAGTLICAGVYGLAAIEAFVA